MIIERNLTAYVVYSEDPVLRALEKITANKSRLIFCVDASGHLDAALSDGDFRRWVSSTADLDVQIPALEVANRDVTASPSPRRPRRSSTHFATGHRPTSRWSTSATTWSPSPSTAATSCGSGGTSSTRTRRPC